MLRIDTVDFQPIISCALRNYPMFIKGRNGGDRGFLPLEKIPGVPTAVWDIKEIIEHYFDVSESQAEKMYPHFCGVGMPGSWVVPHLDAHQGYVVTDDSVPQNPKIKIHRRYLVMISKPEQGGNPIISGNELTITEGDVWSCDVAVQAHGSIPVIGAKPRIVLSYGYLL